MNQSLSYVRIRVLTSLAIIGLFSLAMADLSWAQPEKSAEVSVAYRATDADNFDWPQWRGKDRRDVSSETGLLQKWPEGGPTRIWLNDNAGLGYAGFSIANNRLFTMGLFADKEIGLCLDASTGEELWRVEIGERYENNWGDGPRSTPTVDGDRVYFMAAAGRLSCFNINDQTKVWSVLMGDFGGAVPVWGFSESPLVHGGQVVCTPGGEQGAIVALDKMTGEKLWQTVDVTDQAHYSSPIVLEKDGMTTYVQLLNSKVVGVDTANGNVRWQADFPGKVAVIPTPVEVNGNIYVTSGYGSGSAMFAVNGNSAKELWMTRSMSNHHGGVIFVDGFIYGHGDKDGFGCQDIETGEFRWADKKDMKKGAVTYADGRFYYINEQDGEVLLIKADPEGFEITGRFTLSPQTEQRKPQGRIWVHPVVANGKLYLRDQEFIMCYDVKQ
jgi:outer membrane protein assembly factor BamB